MDHPPMPAEYIPEAFIVCQMVGGCHVEGELAEDGKLRGRCCRCGRWWAVLEDPD